MILLLLLLLLSLSSSSSSNKAEMGVAQIMSFEYQKYINMLLMKPERNRLVGRPRHRWEDKLRGRALSSVTCVSRWSSRQTL
jgi:hypothetical protein